MKPLKLEFKGVNSFSEHTVIDFEKLTANGIFGIFGDTGSGKSTILDCINFALYGSVERSKEKSDIINYGCRSCEVRFVFETLDKGKRNTYTVERVLKKDKNGTHRAVLYEKDGENELCIAEKALQTEKKIVEILGVDENDFRKCIALPQGEFSQFVKSAPRERLSLIERLFSLSKYGDRLKEKIAIRLNRAEGEFQKLSGILQGYETVTAEALEELKSEYSRATEKLKELNESFGICNKESERLKALADKRSELEVLEKSLARMQSEKLQIEELKKNLSVLPVCREAVKTNETVSQKISEVEKIGAEIDALESRLKINGLKITETESRLREEKLEELIDECLNLSARFQAIEGKPEKLKTVLNELEAKRAEYRNKEKEFLSLSKQYERARSEYALAENDLKSRRVSDLDYLINVQFKGAVLKSEYAENLGFFARFESGVRQLGDDSPLYEYVSDETRKKIEEYKSRLLDVKDFDMSDVGERLKSIKENDGEREKLQKILLERKDALSDIESALKVKQTELKTVRESGAELKRRADEIEEEIKRATGGSFAEYEDSVRLNTQKLNGLKERKKSLTENLENLKNSEKALEVELSGKKILKQSLDLEIQTIEKQFNKLVYESRLESYEDCKRLCEKFKDSDDAERTVVEFEKSLHSVSVRLEELKKVEGIEDFSVEAASAAESEKKRIEELISGLTGETAVLKSGTEIMSSRLDEKSAILKDYEKNKTERELIYRLKEATKNNKFLEFIANEYLCEISALASSTLLNLTNGRYFLEYKENNFYVGDNFDCGNLRGVNTLSGGETFLVSLSLALALSQTICARSMKSIEFFFLDEGFGTLDSTLVDTVMNALEKLKSRNFVIGVISHVEELKHRIDSKIIVNKATENHGSTVSVSC